MLQVLHFLFTPVFTFFMKRPQCITHPAAHLQLERESVGLWSTILRCSCNLLCDLRCTCNLWCENGCAFIRNYYEERVRSMQNVPSLVTDFLLFFPLSLYHDFSRCTVNIFRLQIGASFFFNTTYHESVPSHISLIHTHTLHFPLTTVPSNPFTHFTATFPLSHTAPPPRHGNIPVSDASFARRHLAVPILRSLQQKEVKCPKGSFFPTKNSTDLCHCFTKLPQMYTYRTQDTISNN
jgi:hypothetical protein